MKKNAPSIIVVGGLNTDIIAAGVNRLLGPGELTYGNELKIAPGGKSRNLAQMISMLNSPGKVAMVGRTSRDDFNLWKVPYQALVDHGVNVDYIKVLDFKETNKFPGIALIPVDESEGQNQIYVLSGINNDFGSKDIDEATELFEQVSEINGMLALSLEMPLETAKYSIKKAKQHGLKVIVDPGGIRDVASGMDYHNYLDLLSLGIDLVKPNEHEAKILTKVEVVDMDSASLASKAFRRIGVPNTLITAREKGAWLFTEDKNNKHIPIPNIDIPSEEKDETGCGDQVMAVICTLLNAGISLEEAAETGILAGTLQFYRSGVDPLKREDLRKHGEFSVM